MLTRREVAAPIIARVLRENEGATEGVIRKALRDAYPFGPRAYHPYKVWLDEIRRQRGIPRKVRRRDGSVAWARGKPYRSVSELQERIREIEAHNARVAREGGPC